MVFFAALLYHAWVGMRDILMDYVKPDGVRLGAADRDRRRAAALSHLVRLDPVGDDAMTHSGSQVRCGDRGRGRLGPARGAGARAGRA